MSQKICPKCGTKCRETARFCISCRQPLTRDLPKPASCPRGHKQDPTWDECPFCKGMGGEEDWAAMSPIAGMETMPMRRNTIVETGLARQTQPEPAAQLPKPVSPRPISTQTPANPVQAMSPETGRKKRSVSPGPPPQSQPIVGALTTFTRSKTGQAFLIREGRNYIGSAAGAQVRLEWGDISPKHAVIACKADTFFIDDCLSETGTWLNGKALAEKAALKHDDVIQTGNVLWRFVTISPPAPQLTQT